MLPFEDVSVGPFTVQHSELCYSVMTYVGKESGKE